MWPKSGAALSSRKSCRVRKRRKPRNLRPGGRRKGSPVTESEEGPCSAASFGQQHFNSPVRHANRVGLKVNFCRRENGFAGADVELSAMQRTFDDVAVEPAVRKQRVGMRAYVIGRKNRSVDV